jgi:hypothetical protein
VVARVDDRPLRPQLTRGARGVAWVATTTTTLAAASAMFVVKRVPFDTPFLVRLR